MSVNPVRVTICSVTLFNLSLLSPPSHLLLLLSLSLFSHISYSFPLFSLTFQLSLFLFLLLFFHLYLASLFSPNFLFLLPSLLSFLSRPYLESHSESFRKQVCKSCMEFLHTELQSCYLQGQCWYCSLRNQKGNAWHNVKLPDKSLVIYFNKSVFCCCK